jgi:hypothetical protein
MKTYKKLLMLLCAVILAGCGSEAVQDITAPSVAGARVMFFNFGVDAPGVNFYANDTKMTAVSSGTCTVLTDANRKQCTAEGGEATTGTNYGAAGASGYYVAIAPGEYTLSGRIAAATDKDLAIASTKTTFADGKAYSFYLSGFYDSETKEADSFVVEDPVIANFDWSVAYVRFVNAVGNAEPMTLYVAGIDGGAEIAVGGSVAYKSAGAFTAVPSAAYDLSVRTAGEATEAVSRKGVSFLPGRIYTITARGDITVTTGTNAPFLDNNANR